MLLLVVTVGCGAETTDPLGVCEIGDVRTLDAETYLCVRVDESDPAPQPTSWLRCENEKGRYGDQIAYPSSAQGAWNWCWIESEQTWRAIGPWKPRLPDVPVRNPADDAESER